MDSTVTRFVVLVPHRDTALIIKKERRRLFDEGLLGAYSFPVAAPLAITKRPLTINELKITASEISAGINGKINAFDNGKINATALIQSYNIIGKELSLSAPQIPEATAFEKIILCTALTKACRTEKFVSIPDFAFRAAAIANMTLRPLDEEFSFEWNIGRLVWLSGRR
jgi:hypothetical protein